jgi:hypothetical protein
MKAGHRGSVILWVKPDGHVSYRSAIEQERLGCLVKQNVGSGVVDVCLRVVAYS